MFYLIFISALWHALHGILTPHIPCGLKLERKAKCCKLVLNLKVSNFNHSIFWMYFTLYLLFKTQWESSETDNKNDQSVCWAGKQNSVWEVKSQCTLSSRLESIQQTQRILLLKWNISEGPSSLDTYGYESFIPFCPKSIGEKWKRRTFWIKHSLWMLEVYIAAPDILYLGQEIRL